MGDRYVAGPRSTSRGRATHGVKGVDENTLALKHIARKPPLAVRCPGEYWIMDSVVMQLADGRRVQLLTLVDTASRMSPAIAAELSLTGERIVAVLDRLAGERALPAAIRVDNEWLFAGQALTAWASRHGVTLEYPRAALVLFNAHLRAADLAQHRFADLAEACSAIEAWRLAYNGGQIPEGPGIPTPEGGTHAEDSATDDDPVVR